jgi:hypothetical protein
MATVSCPGCQKRDEEIADLNDRIPARYILREVRDYLGKEAYDKAVRTGRWPYVNDK